MPAKLVEVSQLRDRPVNSGDWETTREIEDGLCGKRSQLLSVSKRQARLAEHHTAQSGLPHLAAQETIGRGRF